MADRLIDDPIARALSAALAVHAAARTAERAERARLAELAAGGPPEPRRTRMDTRPGERLWSERAELERPRAEFVVRRRTWFVLRDRSIHVLNGPADAGAELPDPGAMLAQPPGFRNEPWRFHDRWRIGKNGRPAGIGRPTLSMSTLEVLMNGRPPTRKPGATARAARQRAEFESRLREIVAELPSGTPRSAQNAVISRRLQCTIRHVREQRRRYAV